MRKIGRLMEKKIYLRLRIAWIILALTLVTAAIVYASRTRGCDSEETTKAKKAKYRMFILILTHPDAMKNRDTIRKTWLSDKYKNVKHLFAVGTKSLRIEQSETLDSENRKYNDLLLLPRLEDSYNSLSKKVLLSIEFISENYQFDFLIKSDDDSLVLISPILRELDKWEATANKRQLYWGYFNGKAHVKRHGPWKEHDWFLCDYYLPYALGGGYVLSHSLVEFIAKNSQSLRLYNSEDVSVGVWLSPVANIERRHDVRFDTEYRSRGCSNDYLITHKQSPESMTNMYDYYRTTGLLCVQEATDRMSYNYNWTVPPSQCCTRPLAAP